MKIWTPRQFKVCQEEIDDNECTAAWSQPTVLVPTWVNDGPYSISLHFLTECKSEVGFEYSENTSLVSFFQSAEPRKLLPEKARSSTMTPSGLTVPPAVPVGGFLWFQLPRNHQRPRHVANQLLQVRAALSHTLLWNISQRRSDECNSYSLRESTTHNFDPVRTTSEFHGSLVGCVSDDFCFSSTQPIAEATKERRHSPSSFDGRQQILFVRFFSESGNWILLALQ